MAGRGPRRPYVVVGCSMAETLASGVRQRPQGSPSYCPDLSPVVGVGGCLLRGVVGCGSGGGGAAGLCVHFILLWWGVGSSDILLGPEGTTVLGVCLGGVVVLVPVMSCMSYVSTIRLRCPWWVWWWWFGMVVWWWVWVGRCLRIA